MMVMMTSFEVWIWSWELGTWSWKAFTALRLEEFTIVLYRETKLVVIQRQTNFIVFCLCMWPCKPLLFWLRILCFGYVLVALLVFDWSLYLKTPGSDFWPLEWVGPGEGVRCQFVSFPIGILMKTMWAALSGGRGGEKNAPSHILKDFFENHIKDKNIPCLTPRGERGARGGAQRSELEAFGYRLLRFGYFWELPGKNLAARHPGTKFFPLKCSERQKETTFDYVLVLCMPPTHKQIIWLRPPLMFLI